MDKPAPHLKRAQVQKLMPATAVESGSALAPLLNWWLRIARPPAGRTFPEADVVGEALSRHDPQYPELNFTQCPALP